MSKFRNRIRDIGRAPGGMGFTALARRERPRYVIVVGLASSVAEAQAAAEVGADAVILEGASAEGLSLKVPVGVRIADATKDEVAAAQASGADFFLFDDGTTHAAALTVEEMGAVLMLGADQDEQRLRSVAAIDLDAVVVEADADTITVREQIELRRVAAMTGATILLQAIGRPTTAMLEAWRDAGAPAVLVPAADVAATMAAAIEVSAPRKSGERRLPVLGGLTQEAPDDEDEDDHHH